jgi:hypothetical protein
VFQISLQILSKTFLILTALTEGFSCFFFSCKENFRVRLTKTGHGPYFPIYLPVFLVTVIFFLVIVFFPLVIVTRVPSSVFCVLFCV